MPATPLWSKEEFKAIPESRALSLVDDCRASHNTNAKKQTKKCVSSRP